MNVTVLLKEIDRVDDVVRSQGSLDEIVVVDVMRSILHKLSELPSYQPDGPRAVVAEAAAEVCPVRCPTCEGEE